MLGSGCRIKVYGEPREEQIIARVRPNRLLDQQDNSTRYKWDGQPSMYKGITQLKDGRWVILNIAGCHGLQSYGIPVCPEDALAEVVASGNAHLLKRKRFEALQNHKGK